MASFLINGRQEDTLPLTDRSIHYGDGLFETIAVGQGRPLCWKAHMQRLKSGCSRLHIPQPDGSLLLREAKKLMEEQDKAVLKIILSRGSGGRGYGSPDSCVPSRILALYPWPDYPESLYRDGIECTLSTVRLGHVPMLAGIKHLNRLEQVLARDDVTGRGFQEGLVRDIEGRIVEGTMSNLFLIRSGQIMTPILEKCGVEGIVRGVILERARDWKLEPIITEITETELERAEEVFVCNSILGVCPVSRYLEKSWPAGRVTRLIRRNLIDDGIIYGQ